jgi:hypothetical protein
MKKLLIPMILGLFLVGCSADFQSKLAKSMGVAAQVSVAVDKNVQDVNKTVQALPKDMNAAQQFEVAGKMAPVVGTIAEPFIPGATGYAIAIGALLTALGTGIRVAQNAKQTPTTTNPSGPVAANTASPTVVDTKKVS